MTQDEIIEMAKESGLRYHIPFFSDSEVDVALNRFAKLVADKERLDCFDAAYQAYATSEVLKAITSKR